MRSVNVCRSKIKSVISVLLSLYFNPKDGAEPFLSKGEGPFFSIPCSSSFSAIFVPVVIAAALASGLFWYFYLNSTGFALPLEIALWISSYIWLTVLFFPVLVTLILRTPLRLEVPDETVSPFFLF